MPEEILHLNKVGVIVIGRNEGERLIGCLESIQNFTSKLVYVDSGSSDGSVFRSREKNIETVELDSTSPFTAARARNEGFRRLSHLYSDLDYVQFVDGDCEVITGWLESAENFLETHHEIAAVCGRLRERYPDRSIYNLLCDFEWDKPAGQTSSCGGIFMTRCTAFNELGGFNPKLIAGEEPELCLRFRRQGWFIQRLEIDMAFHDANITSFRQWWIRAMRAGYTFAEGAYLHGKKPERHHVKEVRSVLFWGVIIPFIAISLTWLFGTWALAILAIYPFQIVRTTLKGNRDLKNNLLRAFFLILGRFPEAVGGFKFLLNRISHTSSKIIEYK